MVLRRDKDHLISNSVWK